MRGETTLCGVLAAFILSSCKGESRTVDPGPLDKAAIASATEVTPPPPPDETLAKTVETSARAFAPFSLDAQGKTLLLKEPNRNPVTVVALDKHEPGAVFGANAPGEAVDHMSVVGVGDLAGDGHTEALVELVMLGNACASSYLLALDTPWGTPARWVTDIFAQCTAGDASLTAKGKKKLIDITTNEGQTSYDFAWVRPPKGGAPVPAVSALPAPRVLSKTVTDAELQTATLDAPKTLTFDLNGDGKPDTIECAPARSTICTITVAPDHEVGVIVAPSLIGVLPSSTRGMRDLLVGTTVVHWNGTVYE